MRVRVEAGVSDYVATRGGTLWVRSESQRCCGGAVTALRAGTSRPPDEGRYAAFEGDLPFTLRLVADAGLPDELTLELRGVARKRPVALWDGCKFKL